MSKATEQALIELDASRQSAAIDLVHRAAEAGDGDAFTLLANWRLGGDVLPRDLFEARRLLKLGREAGNSDAALREVALCANGGGGDADWQGALQLLRAAADRHGAAAAEQLALVEAMDIDETGFPRSFPSGEELSVRPLIRRWQQLLTPAECAHVALSVQDILEPSLIADPRTGRLIPHPIRQSSAAPVGPTRETLPIQAIRKRIAVITGTQVRQAESLTVLHYAPGQQYRMHNDTLPVTDNQRVSTAILYLNHGFTGGETSFEESGLSIAGKGGDAIFFENVTREGVPDPAARHAGLPVRQGAKWVATCWIRQRPFDVWTGPEHPWATPIASS